MKEKDTAKDAKDRVARRAAALRRNLARRKAQARARTTEDGSDGAVSEKSEPEMP